MTYVVRPCCLLVCLSCLDDAVVSRLEFWWWNQELDWIDKGTGESRVGEEIRGIKRISR